MTTLRRVTSGVEPLPLHWQPLPSLPAYPLRTTLAGEQWPALSPVLWSPIWLGLLDKVPISDLGEELSLQPTVFYRWQKEFFENGAAAFQTTERPRRQVEEKQKRIEFLEKKVQTKDEVLAELMAEHIALKKSLGEL